MFTLYQTYLEDPKIHLFLKKALRLRESYCADASHNFPEMTKRALHKHYKSETQADQCKQQPKQQQSNLANLCILSLSIVVNYEEPPVIREPWTAPQVPEDAKFILKVEQGVIRVYKTAQDEQDQKRKCCVCLFVFSSH